MTFDQLVLVIGHSRAAIDTRHLTSIKKGRGSHVVTITSHHPRQNSDFLQLTFVINLHFALLTLTLTSLKLTIDILTLAFFPVYKKERSSLN